MPTLLIASPRGDLPFDPAHGPTPLEGCPLGTTYAAYFAGLTDFVAGPAGPAIDAALAAADVRPHDADGPAGTARTDDPDAPRAAPARIVSIRAEKHGALYHPASVLAEAPDGRRLRLCVNVAATPEARAVIEGEAALLAFLHEGGRGRDLPRPLAFHHGPELSYLLEDWFEGFYEYHAGPDGFEIWDYDRGLRPLSEADQALATRKAAALLARRHDLESAAQIHPWSLAAGDFVIRTAPPGQAPLDGPEVRLVTARGYGPLFVFPPEAPMPEALSLAHFIIQTSLGLRLDRLSGVGRVVWLPEATVAATIHGIMDGLADDPEADALCGQALDLLASLPAGVVAGIIADMADLYPDEEAAVVREKAAEQAGALLAALGEEG